MMTDKEIYKEASKRLFEELTGSIKMLSNKHIRKYHNFFVVQIPLGYVLSFCCDYPYEKTHAFSFDKCCFSLKHIEKARETAQKTMDNLSTIQEMVEKSFKVHLDTGESVEFYVSLKLTPSNFLDYWEIRISRKRPEIMIIINPYLIEKYPPEIKKIFPEDAKMSGYYCEKVIPYADDAEKMLLKIIKTIREVYEKMIKKYDERMEFLKQPVESYSQLDRPGQARSVNAVPRYLKYLEWEKEIVSALENLLNTEAKKVDPAEVLVEGYLTFDMSNEKDVKSKIESIEKLRDLFSHFPETENNDGYDLSVTNYLLFNLSASGDSSIMLPSKCVVKTRKGNKIKLILLAPPNATRMRIHDWLNVLKRKVKEEFKKSQAIAMAGKAQKKSKKMVL